MDYKVLDTRGFCDKCDSVNNSREHLSMIDDYLFKVFFLKFF